MKRSQQDDDDVDLKKRESAPANNNNNSSSSRTTNNSGHGALAAAARDHELLQLKASLRRSDQNNNNKSDPSFATPTSPTERSATTARTVSERGALWERARSHPLLQAKVALAGNGGDNASLADVDSNHFSIESFVDDDLPMVEIENAPHHELLQAKVNIRSTSVTGSSHHQDGENWAAGVSPVNHYRYQQAPATTMTTTSMPRDPVEWIQPNLDNYNYNSNDNNLPAINWEENEMLEEHRSSTLSLGLRSRVSSGDFAEDGDGGEDSRSQDDGTLALTATVVDEDQERQRMEQESRQSILDQSTPAVHAEVVDLQKRRRTIAAIVVCVLIVIGSLVTALTLTSRAAQESPTMAPTVALVDVMEWVSIVNNVTLSGQILAYPPPEQDATVEEQALAWLIDVESDMVPYRLAAQHYAMVVLALDWNYTEWNLTAGFFEECQRTGVECDLNDSVIEIDLKGLGLSGTIPPDIALLTNMERLVLNKNNLTGTVPWVPMMTYMTKIEYLDVDYNLLTGPLPSPWNGTWPVLGIFWAAWNQFSGTISPGFSHWPALKDLYIKDNKLTGTIPSELGDLSTLYWFSVGENFIHGTLPTEIGRWSKIVHFEVHQTGKLNGTIPTEVGSWTLVKDVFFHSNQFTGTLPTEIGQWASLNRLRAEFNQFNGTLPTVIGNWSEVTHFYVSNNAFSGTVPAGIKNWTALEEIELNNNRLNGTFPTDLESWKKIKAGAFFVNDLTGSLEALCGNESRATLSADCCELQCSCCKSCFVDHGTICNNTTNTTNA
jgi:hypothetical protein